MIVATRNWILDVLYKPKLGALETALPKILVLAFFFFFCLFSFLFFFPPAFRGLFRLRKS